MATTEVGHALNRFYADQDGNLHLNGSSLYLDESGAALTPTEGAYLDGITAGTTAASKAMVTDANGAIGQVLMNGAFRLKSQTAVAANGAVQANAGIIVGSGLTKVTGADNTTCVILPATLTSGEVCVIASNAAGKTLKIFPPIGGQINEGGANVAWSATAIANFGVTTIITAESNTSCWAK